MPHLKTINLIDLTALIEIKVIDPRPVKTIVKEQRKNHVDETKTFERSSFLIIYVSKLTKDTKCRQKLSQHQKCITVTKPYNRLGQICMHKTFVDSQRVHNK